MERNSCRLLVSAILAIALLNASSSAEDDSSYRLPDDIWPISYDIKLRPNYPELVSDVSGFEGDVEIIAEANTATDTIRLHIGNNVTVTETIVVSEDRSTTFEIDEPSDYNKTTEIKYVTLKSDLTEGQKIRIIMAFTGKLETDMSGFYKSTYSVKSSTGEEEEKMLLTTQFQTTHARKVFPCFDEPKFKATFKVNLDVPVGYGALSNTEGVTTEGSTRIQFEETVTMSTYLLAFIIYEKESFGSSITVLGTNNVKYTSWGRATAMQNHQGDYSQTLTHRVISELEEFTNIPYSKDNLMTKVDQAAIPDFSAGAMENWGLVTYRETRLLFDENNNTEESRQSVATVIAHELTHQWFGNLVTLEWWSATWLNEGFARFFQYFILDDIYPQWRMMEQFVVDQQMSVFATDALLSAVPLYRNVSTHSEIDDQFSSAAYSKGGSIVRLLSIVLGPEHFQSGLREYLDQRKYNTTTPEELFEILDYSKPEDMKLPDGFEFTDLITWSNTAGYPIVTFELDRQNKNITIRQQRFLLENTTNLEDTIYPVYLEWSTKTGSHAKHWLVEKESSSSEAFPEYENDWFIVNNTGYFRVNYDIENWNNLYNQLTEDHTKIAPLDRATFADNALNLARVGTLTYDRVLKLLRYLSKETDYIPWKATFTGFSFLHRMLNNVDPIGLFKMYVARLTVGAYNFLGFQDRGDHLEKIQRASILSWACLANNADCKLNAITLLRAYVDEGKSVPANLRSVVYCYGINYGSSDLWWKMWLKLQENDDASERALIITALGCSQTYSTLYMYLEQSLSNDLIKQQDAASVFSAVYTNPKGVDVALDFLIENFDRVKETYVALNALKSVVTGLANYITTNEQKAKMQKLVEDHQESLETIGKAALTIIDTNINWLATYKDDVLFALFYILLTEENKNATPKMDPLFDL